MLLDGRELAGFIKERQAQAVRSLRGSKIFPKLAIVLANDSKASATYVRQKQSYGQDIGIEVELHQVEPAQLEKVISDLNNDKSVHGVIVQLPLPNSVDADKALNLVDPKKDVDGLGDQALLDPATPTAIMWLLAGYNVELANKKIVLIGQGKLVGKPLAKMLSNMDLNLPAGQAGLILLDDQTKDLAAELKGAEIIISATGVPGLITSAMIPANCVVVDAGTAEAEGKLVGDVGKQAYERSDIKVAPVPGGVGPLTVCALFENVLTAARN